MSPFEFERLMKYVDGELNDDECAKIEASLPTDPSAREVVADLRAQRVELRDEFLNGQDFVPRPELLNSIDRVFADKHRESRRKDIARRWALPMAASIVMAFIGSIAGYLFAANQIDAKVDRVIAAHARDDIFSTQALLKALEHHGSGEEASWSNPDSGALGMITPIRTFRTINGQWCREFEREVQSRTGGNQTTGVACRHKDGEWRLVHERPKDI